MILAIVVLIIFFFIDLDDAQLVLLFLMLIYRKVAIDFYIACRTKLANRSDFLKVSVITVFNDFTTILGIRYFK